MNKDLFVDIDGVLRNLNEIAFGFEPPIWDYKNERGEDLISILKQHPEYNIKAKPYSYISVINKLPKVKFLTATLFRKETEEWLSMYLKTNYTVYYVSETKQKIGFLNKWKSQFLIEPYLIDDSPKLEELKNLILINRNYNKGVFPFVRIFNEKELEVVLENLEFLKKGD